MWTIIVLATSIFPIALGNMAPYQSIYHYSQPQDYKSGATYGDWSPPTKSFQHQLLDTFSSICPGCLKGDGVDEVTGISGLKDAIEYSYYHTIKPTMNEMIYNLGMDKLVTYRYIANICDRNQHVIQILPAGDVLKMFCSDVDQTVQQGYF